MEGVFEGDVGQGAAARDALAECYHSADSRDSSTVPNVAQRMSDEDLAPTNTVRGITLKSGSCQSHADQQVIPHRRVSVKVFEDSLLQPKVSGDERLIRGCKTPRGSLRSTPFRCLVPLNKSPSFNSTSLKVHNCLCAISRVFASSLVINPLAWKLVFFGTDLDQGLTTQTPHYESSQTAVTKRKTRHVETQVAG